MPAAPTTRTMEESTKNLAKAPTTVPWDTTDHSFAARHPFAVGQTLVVAADGSGDFKQVQQAIDFIPDGTKDPVAIHIKPGTYKEHIFIGEEKPPIRMYGDDPAKTILSYNLHAKMIGDDGNAIGTFGSASTVVNSNDFEADDLTFENSTRAIPRRRWP